MPEHNEELVIHVLNGDEAEGGGGASPARPVPAEAGGAAVKRAKGTLEQSFVAREINTVTKRAVSFAVSNVGLATGNSISQERMQYALNSVSKVATYGVAIATGNYLAAGIMAIGDITTIVEKGIRLNIQNSIESESLALSRDRAGVAFNSSRMGAAK